MAIESIRKAFRDTADEKGLDEYSNTTRRIQGAMFVTANPPSQQEKDENPEKYLFVTRQEYPDVVAEGLDPERPAVKAAMFTGAASFARYLYSESGNSPFQFSFKNLWKDTPLEGLAENSELALEEVKPKTTGEFVNIDLKAMQEKLQTDLVSGVQEHIIVTGLNGVGKSKMGDILINFIECCGLKSKIVKFPRPDGPISGTIDPILKGTKTLKPDATQLLFLSDAVDFGEDEPETLLIFDRHPQTETLVYGPQDKFQLTSLAAREMLNGIYWTFIFDRHPGKALSSVKSRSRTPRVFENKLDLMIEQLTRFAGLTSLPATYWINMDIPNDSELMGPSWPIRASLQKFIGAICSSGILQRQLVKQGLKENFNSANEFLFDKFVDKLTSIDRIIA